MIPIIYCNAGKRPWMEYAVKCVQKFCPSADIRLITDCDERYPGVRSYAMHDYNTGADRLIKNYKHMSFNPDWFEIGCLKRWPIVLDFIRANGIESFVVADWDILFCTDYNELADTYKDYDFTYQNGASIGLSYWASVRPLEWLVDLINANYEDLNSEMAVKTKKIWDWHKESKSPGGVSDMLFAVELVQRSGFKCFDTYIVQTDAFGRRFCWDNNMSGVSGGWAATSKDTKDVAVGLNGVLCHNKYHGDVIMKCMHFAGHSRGMIQEYYKRLV